jgi:membrane protease YdiL (CAAX protease family)
MRPIRSLLFYLLAVFVGGALLAPWLFWLTQHMAAAHWTLFEKLAKNPFHRFVVRSMLGLAFLGLWPLLRSCRMLHWWNLGLTTKGQPLKNMVLGFLVGFGSLACVAGLALLFGGRSLNLGHSSSEVAKHLTNAGLSALIVAFLEEILFRGALFGILRKTWAWPIAVVLSSAIYALAHFFQKAEPVGDITWLSGLELLPKMFCAGQPPLVPAVLVLFVAGAILALAYQRTGTLFFSMGLHAGWIFWVKSYGFITITAPGASPALWGTGSLIDGWLALPILSGVFWIVSIIKLPSAGRA